MPSALVVDDDHDICELVSFKLEQMGFDVRRAANGEEALGAVAAEQPDVVLLDLMMPGMSGLEVLEHWRTQAATAQMRVVMLTAVSQPADVERGLELGADDYLVKPFSPRDLVARVNAILERPRH